MGGRIGISVERRGRGGAARGGAAGLQTDQAIGGRSWTASGVVAGAATSAGIGGVAGGGAGNVSTIANTPGAAIRHTPGSQSGAGQQPSSHGGSTGGVSAGWH